LCTCLGWSYNPHWPLPNKNNAYTAGDSAPGSGNGAFDDIPVVGEAYLQEYADLPWVSLAKSPTRSDNKNRRQVGGRAANNTLSRRWSETPGSKQQGHRGGHSYGEFQLQELPAPDVLKKRKELDNNYYSNLT
jgi:hypothetical protein